VRPLPDRLFAANIEAVTEIAASHRADMEQFATAGPAALPPTVGWPEELLPSEAAAPTDTVIAPDETALAALQAEPAAAHEVPPAPMLGLAGPCAKRASGGELPRGRPIGRGPARIGAGPQAASRRAAADLPITIVVLGLVNLASSPGAPTSCGSCRRLNRRGP